MQVYVEFALLENFCMDFTLLYCAKLVTKNRAGIFRIAIAAVFGACFAVVFPLFNLNAALSASLKIISGFIICLLACKFKGFKAYFKMTAVFMAFTFVLGGALIGIFSLAGISYESGNGYYLSSVPVGIPLFCALCLIIAARKIAQRLKKSESATVKCVIFAGGKHIEIDGFYDSGNKVYHFGQPVSVIPFSEAEKLVDVSRIKDEVKIHTVAGSKKLKIFTADKLEITGGKKPQSICGVKIGISAAAISSAVLHPDLLEE